MATKKEVREFLDKFRMVAGSPRRLILLRSYPGGKNSEGLLDLGLTEMAAKEEIFQLRVEDYSAGPEEDRDKPGQKVLDICTNHHRSRGVRETYSDSGWKS